MNNIVDSVIDRVETNSITTVDAKEKLPVKHKKVVYHGIKRTFDIFCSIIGCILMLPIIVIVKICYMVTGDFHPIIFSQMRIGKDGKEFKFYKIRSMVPNADEILFKILEEGKEDAEEYKQNKKLKDDPRITKIGKIIRKTSIDELPQMLNILKGDMSLIGNRPYLPREKEDMGEYYDEIIISKPGLTGLWQTSGRSDTTFEERLKLEAEYSNNMSLLLDIKIFLKTFIVMLKGL